MIEQYAQVNRLFWNGSAFQYVFYASTVLILIFEKNRMRKIVLGVFPIVMLAGMYNPAMSMFIRLFFEGSPTYYVRLFTIIPVYYSMAHGMMMLLKKTQGAVKLAGVCLALGLVVVMGHSLYQEPWMQRAENVNKTPNEVFLVLDAIPRDKENVCVAFPDPLYLYARQVDGNIIMPYGRQLNGTGSIILDELNKPVPDVMNVMARAATDSVDYIVVHRSKEARNAFDDCGYKPIGKTPGYYVYPVTGVPKSILALDEKRRVLSKTACDAQGNPTNENVVTTTITYAYDRWGNPIGEAYFDKDGRPVTTSEGYAGRKKGYRMGGLSMAVNSITHLDTSGQPMLISGRYETRYQYDRDSSTRVESYHDQAGNLMNRTDTGYAICVRQYDETNHVTAESYMDTAGRAVLCARGYARYERGYDGNHRLASERFFDAEGSPTDVAGGFAERSLTYDEAGNIVKEAFSDRLGRVVDIRARFVGDRESDLMALTKRESVADGVGIGYRWNDDGSCTITGEAKGNSWNSMLEQERPYYFINGETYRVEYSAENVYLRIYFFEDASWGNKIGDMAILKDAEFTVPQNCGAMIIRLWVAPGTRVDETVHPCIYKK